MHFARSAVAVSAVALLGGLTACGTSDAAQPPAEEQRAATAQQAGTDDGGRLCDALDSWKVSVMERAVDWTDILDAIEFLRENRASFLSEVAPSVPGRLAAEAEAYAAAMGAAADELAALDPATLEGATLETLFAENRIPLNGELVDLWTPSQATMEDPRVVYPNELVAWIAEPCGPKALEREANFGDLANQI